MQFWQARRAGRQWLEWRDRPDMEWSRFGERTVVLLTILWLALQVTAKITPDPAPKMESLTTNDLLMHFVVSSGMTLMLVAIMLSSQRPAVEFGLNLKSLRDQVRDGFNGFFLAVLPMAVTIVLTASLSLRTEETQNPLLRLLTETGNPIDVVLVGLLAVVVAPLSEEMMFRVILQGWLTTVVRPGLAILIVVALFAAIHGLADGLALLPLATVLGYLFYRRHSYVSVVVIHFLFNATMLVLQLLTQTKKIP